MTTLEIPDEVVRMNLSANGAAGRAWLDRGIQWLQLGVDYMYLRERMRELYTALHRPPA